MTVEQIKEQGSKLTPEERANLALFFLRSLEEEEEEDEQVVKAAWREEIARRAAEIRSGEAVGIPAEEFFPRLREKLREIHHPPQ
jgi:putative addiction module component (TIGR02574 family)